MDYEAILTRAQRAATAAIRAKFDAGDEEQPLNCGCAWVVIPGNSKLAAFCRRFVPADPRGEARADPADRARYGTKGYPGWQWWRPGTWPSSRDVGRQVYGQDMDFAYAGARAFAEELNKAIPGLNAAAKQRLD